MTSNVKVFEIKVTFTHFAQNTQYNKCETGIRCETGLKPHFVHRRERFSFMIDDVEMNTVVNTAAGFVNDLRAARLAAKLGKTVTVEIVSGTLYGTESEKVMTHHAAGFVWNTNDCRSDAAKFIATYIATGDETALLALSDYLEEKSLPAIAVAGVLADIVARDATIDAQRKANEAEALRSARAREARRNRFATSR
jgi:hypothetical protein